VRLVEAMVKVNPSERIDLAGARNYIKSVREQISVSGSIRMLDEEEPSVPKLSYKFTSKNFKDVLKSITSNGENKL
jgi:hypothetical protein